MTADLNVSVDMELSYAESLVIYKTLCGKAISSDEDKLRKQIVADLKEQLFLA